MSPDERIRRAERAIEAGDEGARARLFKERERAAVGEPGGFTMLPAAAGTCPECAVTHELEEAHNKQSLFYQMRFRSQRGRFPTWKDAIAHCAPGVRALWEQELRKRGAWDGDEEPEVEEIPTGRIGSMIVVPIEQPKRRRRRS